MAQADHNVLIKRAARAALRPIGCIQKGQSRTWLDDNHWWVTVVEFQPSGWSKGTYLNVGCCWLWHPKNHLSFDDGYRVESFQTAKNPQNFQSAVERVAARSMEEVFRLRHRFPTIHAAAEYLRDKESGPVDIWGHYHAGVSCGLAGWSSESERRLRIALEMQERNTEWVINIKEQCSRLLALVNNTPSFREHISGIVSASRVSLKLPTRAGVVFSNIGDGGN